MIGCDAGLLVHNVTPDQLCAAIVFAPETSLEKAMTAVVACGVGFQNALAPPEVAVHLGWQGELYVNGAQAGHIRFAAPHPDPASGKLPVAIDELNHMVELCEGHDANTLLTVARELTEAGVAETYRVIDPSEAELDILAVHGDWPEMD